MMLIGCASVWLVGLVIAVVVFRKAPLGYQDEHAWHPGIPPNELFK